MGCRVWNIRFKEGLRLKTKMKEMDLNKENHELFKLQKGFPKRHVSLHIADTDRNVTDTAHRQVTPASEATSSSRRVTSPLQHAANLPRYKEQHDAC